MNMDTNTNMNMNINKNLKMNMKQIWKKKYAAFDYRIVRYWVDPISEQTEISILYPTKSIAE